jgi:hypothetical protein
VSLSVEVFTEKRIYQLGMQYAAKLKAYSSDFAHDCVFYPLYENVYHKQPNTIKFDELRIKSYIENSNINLIQNIVLAPDFMTKIVKKSAQDFFGAVSKVFDRVKTVALWSAKKIK